MTVRRLWAPSVTALVLRQPEFSWPRSQIGTALSRQRAFAPHQYATYARRGWAICSTIWQTKTHIVMRFFDCCELLASLKNATSPPVQVRTVPPCCTCTLPNTRIAGNVPTTRRWAHYCVPSWHAWYTLSTSCTWLSYNELGAMQEFTYTGTASTAPWLPLSATWSPQSSHRRKSVPSKDKTLKWYHNWQSIRAARLCIHIPLIPFLNESPLCHYYYCCCYCYCYCYY